ncbi:MAG: hypothetical protein ACJAT1_002442 [Marivirga sp.]|jgi:hypothetical protein
MDNTKRIFLWSGPRNISTTLMYSFAQRADTEVFDEPLYGAYLKDTSAQSYHPDAQMIMDDMECNKEKVVEMMLGPHGKKVVFFKNMTHHLMGLDKSFLRKGFNILLTRDPKEMLPSFDKVIPNPALKDVGYQEHAALLSYLKEEGIPYAVLDAKQTLLNPENVLSQLCEKAAIAFDKSMLRWPAGPRVQDGIWAQHWYDSVHSSTGFKPYQPKEKEFPQYLEDLLKESQPYYEALAKEALITSTVVSTNSRIV